MFNTFQTRQQPSWWSGLEADWGPRGLEHWTRGVTSYALIWTSRSLLETFGSENRFAKTQWAKISRILWWTSRCWSHCWSQVLISPAGRESAGIYTCTAHNKLGVSGPREIQLDVECELDDHMNHWVDIFNVFFCRLASHHWRGTQWGSAGARGGHRWDHMSRPGNSHMSYMCHM